MHYLETDNFENYIYIYYFCILFKYYDWMILNHMLFCKNQYCMDVFKNTLINGV